MGYRIKYDYWVAFLSSKNKNYYLSLVLLYSSILYFYVKIYVNHDTSRGDVAFSDCRK